MTTVDSTAVREPTDWRGLFVSLLTVVLVAVPVAIAWTVGFMARCAALVVAASAEAFDAGRGPRV